MFGRERNSGDPKKNDERSKIMEGELFGRFLMVQNFKENQNGKEIAKLHSLLMGVSSVDLDMESADDFAFV